jgi:isopropylmalate/homocitrate/citramalate synthase
MTPERVGVKQTSLVMRKHSGRHAFIHKLKDLGALRQYKAVPCDRNSP